MWRVFMLVLLNPVSSSHHKLFNSLRKPRLHHHTTTTTAVASTKTPPIITVASEIANKTDLAQISIENTVDLSAVDDVMIPQRNTTPCPSEPVARIGSFAVITQLDFLTMVINAFSSKVDEYYESQIRFLKFINELIKATIEISEKCVINRRRWMYKSCVKGIVTRAKQASRQSIVEYEKLRKEAVWFAKHGACSLDEMPLDVIGGLRKIAVDSSMAELTAPGVEHHLVECEKYCHTDPVIKNLIRKMDSSETDRGNSYQLSNVVMRTDEERLHKIHSQEPHFKNKSPFISKSWT